MNQAPLHPDRAFHSAPIPGVLHVIDLPSAGWDALASAALCARELNVSQRLVLIGDRRAGADAAAFGLAPDRHLSPPLRSLTTAVRLLDRAVTELHRESPIGVVHVWSDSARVLCRQTIGYTYPLTQEDPGPLVPSPTAQALAARATLRAELGISDNEVALLLATDRPGVGDARRFAGLVGVLHLADIPTVGLAPARSDYFRRAARFLRGFNRAWDVIPLRSPAHLVLAAADAVFYDQGDTLTAAGGPGAPTGGLAFAAAAAGIPVVTIDSPLGRRLAGPLGGEVLARTSLMPEFARVTVPLCESAQRRAETGARLRQHAFRSRGVLSALHDRWNAAALKGAAA